MMNAFIDLGAYRGLYINRFKKSKYYTPDTKIYAFECNPHLRTMAYGNDVITIRKAAWIYDGELDFYLSRQNPSLVQGSSAYKEKTTGNLDTAHPVKVQCIDFSKFLSDNFTAQDNVAAKINIEGAEYDVLEKCIKDKTIEILKEIWVSWHHVKIKIDMQRHHNLVNELKQWPHLIVNSGAGKLNGK